MKTCKYTNCKNPTTARNGICVDCFRTKKHLKKYLNTKEGLEHIQVLLFECKGMLTVDSERFAQVKEDLHKVQISLDRSET